MSDKQNRAAPRHFDPHWVPSLPECHDDGSKSSTDRKTDPDGTDEYQSLIDPDDGSPSED